MIQNAVVLIIVLIAALFIGKRIYRTFSGRKVGCGCEAGESSANCSMTKPIEIQGHDTPDSKVGLKT